MTSRRPFLDQKSKNIDMSGDKMIISYSKLDEIDHSWYKKARGIQF